MSHRVDGYNVEFCHRGAWKANVNKPGKQPIATPVSWQNDYNFSQRQLIVWFKDLAEVKEYQTRTQPFLVPLIVPKDNDPRAFGRFTGVFVAQSTGNVTPCGHGVITTVIGRG
jgi:hypothetical protein